MEYIGTAIWLGMAFGAAIAGVLGVVAAVHFTSRREDGWLFLVFYAIFLSTAMLALFSGRDLSGGVDTRALSVGAHPVVTWTQRAVSIFLLVVSGERLASVFIRRMGVVRRVKPPIPALLPIFALFWLGTVASPSVLSANPYFSHDYVYSLLVGAAALLVSHREADRAIIAFRNAVLIFIVVGLLAALVRPSLVLEMSYNQGLIPGLPRFSGAAPHAVSLGIIVQVGLYCLWVRPLSLMWLNRLAWLTGLVVLFMAQSKTAWVSFAVCSLVLLAVRHGSAFKRLVFDSTKPLLGVSLAFVIMCGAMALFGMLFLSDAGQAWTNFLLSSEGAQLTSLTGRDQIWTVALEEWRKYPWFGYGHGLFSESFRALIGMPNATHGHNQFMDTLARTGTVGAATLTLYVALLMALSIRHAKRTGGLSAALFMAIFMRGIAEVPLSMNGYGFELAVHALLLVVLAGAIRSAYDERQAFRPTMPAFQRA